MAIWDIPDGTYVFKGGFGVCVAKGTFSNTSPEPRDATLQTSTGVGRELGMDLTLQMLAVLPGDGRLR